MRLIVSMFAIETLLALTRVIEVLARRFIGTVCQVDRKVMKLYVGDLSSAQRCTLRITAPFASLSMPVIPYIIALQVYLPAHQEGVALARSRDDLAASCGQNLLSGRTSVIVSTSAS